MSLGSVKELDQKYFMNTFGSRTSVCFESGRGMSLFSSEGKEYRDFFSGIAVTAIGHSHPYFVAALQDQAAKLLHTSNIYYNENQALLAEKLVNLSCADKVFFSNSGAEANEGAFKLAKIYFYKKGLYNKINIISLTNSFHGRTLATVAATGQPKYQKPYKPLTPGFIHAPINDFEYLKNIANENTAAIILELIQGEHGVFPVTKEYIKKVKELCCEKDIILIFDEIQTGLGRTGSLFAYEQFDTLPDIFTLAKALGGGIPIGAICAKNHVASAFEPGDHGSTFGGNPFATRAGLAVLEIFEKEGLVNNSKEMGLYFKNALLKLKETYPVIKDIRGFGLMLGVDFENAEFVQKELFEKCFLTGRVNDTLRILPPLIISETDIDEFIKTLKEILA